MADEKTKTVKRVPLIAVTVIRDGKRHTPPIGKKAFAFTQDEIDSVLKADPKAFREAVNEDTDPNPTAPEQSAKPTGTDTPKTTRKKAAAEKDSGAAEKPVNANDDANEGDEDDDI